MIPNRFSILIVDDHEMVREGIKLLLQNNIDSKVKIHTAKNAKEALRKCNSSFYHLIFMDIRMPEIDGIEATKLILEKWKTKIIALSMHTEYVFIEKMLDAGASGYLLKNSSPDDLKEAIKCVLNGERYFDKKLPVVHPAYQKLYLKLTANKKPKEKINLTKRENEVLSLILQELTNEEIANKLILSKRTIDNVRQNILMKFEVKNTVGLIKQAQKHNLI